MPSEIYLVKVGMTMEEGTVEEWYIADGARVEPGEMLYRLETEKVNLDVDAETSGTVRHLADAGTTCKPGDVVGFIYADDEVIPDVLPTPKPKPDIAVASDTVGDDKSAKPVVAKPKRAGGRIAASPVARKLAGELGIDLANLTGTGPRGRITKEDVQAAADAAATAPAGPQSGSSTPLTGMRRTIAERMHGSLRDTAQLTMDMEVAMDDAVKLRRDLLAEWEGDGIRVTYTDLVLAAATKALGRYPAMNSALQANALVRFEAVHIGLAVALEEGLIVPVIKDANSKTLRELASVSADLAKRARDGKLTLADVEGGTFTVTSLGMYGVDTFTPILNPPQAGILGVGRIYDGVRWAGDTAVKAAMMRLSLTWDHRVLDGAPAAEFLAAVRDFLESPYRLLV
ncbi:MAG: 2-oxo acid dehydrogenase subunit E2 [Gammaproteobacteria bacterium]|nr:2-oxo acid dehydrogenase subunit E2 [Gammaproteobacteria bacterium]MYK47869.1 2-oxo acid dehydrogenase subunit E2 [Gammaproteobacteria bacterium]